MSTFTEAFLDEIVQIHFQGVLSSRSAQSSAPRKVQLPLMATPLASGRSARFQ